MKEDNAKIFNHLEEIIKNKSPQPATEEAQGSGDDSVEETPTSEAPVVIQSSAASKEQELFMQQQMELNQKLLKKLGNLSNSKVSSSSKIKKNKKNSSTKSVLNQSLRKVLQSVELLAFKSVKQ